MSPFWSLRLGACQEILTLVELMEATVTLRGGPVGTVERVMLEAKELCTDMQLGLALWEIQ